MDPIEVAPTRLDREMLDQAVKEMTDPSLSRNLGSNQDGQARKNEWCETCKGTGWQIIQDPNGHERAKSCICRDRMIAEARIRVILQDWSEHSAASLMNTEFRNAGQAAALEKIRKCPGGSYFITGFYSRGKTYLLVAQYRYLALAGKTCILTTSRALMEELRRAELPPEKGEQQFVSPVLQMINESQDCHLFIDDLEKSPARSEFRREMLFALLDTIKRKQLGLTVTSNKGMKEIAAVIGNQSHSRLYALCEVLEL
jgi:DNA replication protein DnaC